MTQGLDEYPAVPFYSLDERSFYYDSTSLAWHLDALADEDEQRLVPDRPELAFVARLIDEAVDEFGLYMVHHNRWVVSAATNNMGRETARQLRIPRLLLPLAARWLARRQSGRCPYLFSVAPDSFDAGVDRRITPPARKGFPPTHDLLDTAWSGYLQALESILSVQPFILGERFSLADASVYGQFSMNLVDGRAAELLKNRAPTTHSWLCRIRQGEHRASRGELSLSPCLDQLLTLIGQTFIPLMQQNHAAWAKAVDEGETVFNEAAFARDRALYDGELMGYSFRHVIKTFQVAVWKGLLVSWQSLDESDRTRLELQLPSAIVDALHGERQDDIRHRSGSDIA